MESGTLGMGNGRILAALPPGLDLRIHPFLFIDQKHLLQGHQQLYQGHLEVPPDKGHHSDKTIAEKRHCHHDRYHAQGYPAQGIVSDLNRTLILQTGTQLEYQQHQQKRREGQVHHTVRDKKHPEKNHDERSRHHRQMQLQHILNLVGRYSDKYGKQNQGIQDGEDDELAGGCGKISAAHESAKVNQNGKQKTARKEGEAQAGTLSGRILPVVRKSLPEQASELTGTQQRQAKQARLNQYEEQELLPPEDNTLLIPAETVFISEILPHPPKGIERIAQNSKKALLAAGKDLLLEILIPLLGIIV